MQRPPDNELLTRAAEAAVASGVELETFMNAAWTAFMDQRPGLREHLEHQHMVEQLEALRAQGKLAQA